eukprot:FR734670.1.p2 GENE.FR734670.1~~FR734670.1.p2  ORF type:complete len:111 (+),score=10.76 FR734670.1:673-1005(+)
MVQSQIKYGRIFQGAGGVMVSESSSFRERTPRRQTKGTRRQDRASIFSPTRLRRGVAAESLPRKDAASFTTSSGKGRQIPRAARNSAEGDAPLPPSGRRSVSHRKKQIRD